jgi:hypothetical protein
MRTSLRGGQSPSMKSAHVNMSIGTGSSFLDLGKYSKSVQERVVTIDEPCA